MPRFFPVSAVTKRIKEYLAPAIEKEFWVKGELYNVSERGGHYYAALIETDPSGKTVARLDVRLWRGVYQQISHKFQKSGMKLKMENGLQYGFLCRLSFHNIFGIALEIRDADPNFNLGEMERRRQEILAQLKRERRFELNKQKKLPFLPQRIGLITSGSSAAYSDFMKTLNFSNWGFQVFLADARMQGDATEITVLKGLAVLQKLDIDLVVITRGGGSKSDLYSLDNLKIALAISEYPIPVWTGIGHEIDISVLDYVAHTSFKTPTAVAEDLVARCLNLSVNLDNFQDRLKFHWQKELQRRHDFLKQALEMLKTYPKIYLQKNENRLSVLAHNLRNKTTHRINSFRLNIQSSQQKLVSLPNAMLQKLRLDLGYSRSSFQLFKYVGLITEQKRQLKEKGKLLRAHDPINNLKKGYSLVYDKKHKLVKSIHELKENTELTTRFMDGEITSRVSQIMEDTNGKK